MEDRPEGLTDPAESAEAPTRPDQAAEVPAAPANVPQPAAETAPADARGPAPAAQPVPAERLPQPVAYGDIWLPPGAKVVPGPTAQTGLIRCAGRFIQE